MTRKTRAPNLVTLLTDFGAQDPYVGVLKGVIASTHPDARWVDLCHSITPQDIRGAAFWLSLVFTHFPPGTVHLVVVDPGVGTERRGLLVEAAGHAFVGPDNGVLTAALDQSGAVAYALPRKRGATTFDGRDLFAPVAAARAAGPLPGLVPVSHPICLPAHTLRAADDAELGLVMTVDRFGNLLTNLPGTTRRFTAVEAAGTLCPWVRSYSEAAERYPGAPTALCNAWGLVELTVGGGSAAQNLGLGPGTRVRPVVAPAR